MFGNTGVDTGMEEAAKATRLGEENRRLRQAQLDEAERIRNISFIDIITNTGKATEASTLAPDANKDLLSVILNNGANLSDAQKKRGKQINGLGGGSANASTVAPGTVTGGVQ